MFVAFLWLFYELAYVAADLDTNFYDVLRVCILCVDFN